MQNVSFVAQAVDWIPEVLYDIVAAAYQHKGLSFVRIIQRCPEWLPKMFEPWLQDPSKTLLLHHEDGLTLSPELAQGLQEPGASTIRSTSIARARSPPRDDPIPVGILYRNPDVPCYEELRRAGPGAAG